MKSTKRQNFLLWIRVNYIALGILLLIEILSSVGLFFDSTYAIWPVSFGVILFCLIGIVLLKMAWADSLPIALKEHYEWQKKTILWHGIWLMLQIGTGVFLIWQMMHYFVAGITYFFTQLFLFIFTFGLKRPEPIEAFYAQSGDVDLFFLHHFELFLILSLVCFPMWVISTQGWFLYRVIKGWRRLHHENP